MYQISLIAAYIAGMVALFAPCCISYLFPAYLANIFKERRQILLMTLVYSLGIMVIILPVVLGAKALAMLFFDLHNQTYIAGGIFMLLVAGLALLGIKLPMPNFSFRQTAKNDVISTFMLGIFAGITSACCAPVLIGVIALSSLSPTVFMSLGIGMFYVLGMVTPLYLASLVIKKNNILEKPFLKRKITQIILGAKTYPIFISNIVAATLFTLTGLIMLWLTSAGGLDMTGAEASIAKTINTVAFQVTDRVNSIPGLDIGFAILMALLIYKLVKNITQEKSSSEDCCTDHSNHKDHH